MFVQLQPAPSWGDELIKRNCEPTRRRAVPQDGVTTGIGAVNTAKVEVGSTAIVLGLGGIGLKLLQGLRLAGADMIIGVDINNDRKAWGEKFGMTHFVNPKEVGDDIVPYLVNLTKRNGDTIGGADYTFDCTGIPR